MKKLLDFSRKIFILGMVFSSSLYSLWDLEERLHDFVLETKQINVPGYPYAFNPSIVRWNDLLLLSFRDIPDPKNSFHSRIGVVLLDEAFNPVTPAQILDTQWEDPFPVRLVPSRSEDARLITVGEKLYMVYSDNKNEVLSGEGFVFILQNLPLTGFCLLSLTMNAFLNILI